MIESVVQSAKSRTEMIYREVASGHDSAAQAIAAPYASQIKHHMFS
jgi:hypothetical protein